MRFCLVVSCVVVKYLLETSGFLYGFFFYAVCWECLWVSEGLGGV